MAAPGSSEVKEAASSTDRASVHRRVCVGRDGAPRPTREANRYRLEVNRRGAEAEAEAAAAARGGMRARRVEGASINGGGARDVPRYVPLRMPASARVGAARCAAAARSFSHSLDPSDTSISSLLSLFLE